MTTQRVPLTPEATRRLTIDVDPWLSCDDCFDQIDEYVDALLAGSPRSNHALCVHLAGCSACYDEARSLVLLAASDSDVDAETALSRLIDR